MNYNYSDWSFLKSDSNKHKKAIAGKGVLSIINADQTKGGARIRFSKQLEEDLDLSDTVQIALADKGTALVIGVDLDATKPMYRLCREKKGNTNSRLVLYNTSVVREVTQRMKLDFSACVSVTFYEIEYVEDDGTIAAYIRKEENNYE